MTANDPCPIVGVAVNDWTLDQLKEHARACIVGTGEGLDPAVFDRFAARLSVQSDFGDPATYKLVGEALEGADTPVFHLEIPPVPVRHHRQRSLRGGAHGDGTRRGGEALGRWAWWSSSTIELDVEFSQERGEAATPYEVSLHAAMIGDSTRFTRQDGVEETWRIKQPLLDAPPPVHDYPQGSWGPQEADELAAGRGRWHEPWVAS